MRLEFMTRGGDMLAKAEEVDWGQAINVPALKVCILSAMESH